MILSLYLCWLVCLSSYHRNWMDHFGIVRFWEEIPSVLILKCLVGLLGSATSLSADHDSGGVMAEKFSPTPPCLCWGSAPWTRTQKSWCIVDRTKVLAGLLRQDKALGIVAYLQWLLDKVRPGMRQQLLCPFFFFGCLLGVTKLSYGVLLDQGTTNGQFWRSKNVTSSTI